jgi:TetR/AcrR family transcriptional repressor of nem operon
MRTEILEIAENQMKAGGYDQLSFAQIAKELSTTRANLHYHFKNKESLAIEVTKRFMADQEADIVKLAAQFHGDFPSFLSGMENMLWSHHKEYGRIGACVCAQIMRQPGAPASLVDLSEKHFELFTKTLFEQVSVSIENGTLRKDLNPMLIAREAGCMMAGLAQMAVMTECKDHKNLKGTLKAWIKNYI